MGHHFFSREFVLRSQYRRMLDAMAQAVAEKGYERTSVADVVDRAGVSRKTFYEHFADKQACFIAAYQTIVADILGAVQEAYDSRRHWPARMSAGLAALLDRLAAEPAQARAGVVEVLAAGQEAIAVRDASLTAFRTFFDRGRQEVPDDEVPPIVVEATVGGIHEVIYRCIVMQGPQALPALHRDLVYLALAPFLGPRAARRASGLDEPGTARRSTRREPAGR